MSGSGATTDEDGQISKLVNQYALKVPPPTPSQQLVQADWASPDDRSSGSPHIAGTLYSTDETSEWDHLDDIPPAPFPSARDELTAPLDNQGNIIDTNGRKSPLTSDEEWKELVTPSEGQGILSFEYPMDNIASPKDTLTSYSFDPLSEFDDIDNELTATGSEGSVARFEFAMPEELPVRMQSPTKDIPRISKDEAIMIETIASLGKLETSDPSNISVNIAEVDHSKGKLLDTSNVLKYLAPQLSVSVSKLINEQQITDVCGSKNRIESVLKTIKASREQAERSDSDESVRSASPVRTNKNHQKKKKKRTKKISKVGLRKREKRLKRTIAKKLDYEDKIFDFAEPLLAREPHYLLNNRVKEYTTVAQHLPKLSFKLRQKTNDFSDLNLLDFRKYEANNQSVVDALWDAMMFLKEYIGADDARIYHNEGDCVVRYVKEQCNRHPTNWPVEPGTIAAAYAAHVRHTLYLEQKDFCNENHPLGLGRSGKQPQRSVILPMLTPNNRVLAVMEFDKNGTGFSEEKIHYALAYGSWVTAALIRKGIRESLREAKDYNATILNCLKCFLHEKLTLNQCISAIMITMREFVRAEEVIFYHIIADKKLDADIYEATSYNRDIFTKVSRKIDLRKDFLMKDVAENHVVVNIHKGDGDQDFRKYNIFDPEINSILCVPIGNPKRLLGIVKIINKLDHPMFFDIDLVNVSNAGMYCTSIIFYTAIGKQLDNTITIANKQKVTLTRHMIPCIHDILQFRSRPITKPPPYYLSFDWYPTKEELAKEVLVDYVWWMFNDLFEGDAFMEKFDVFLLMCKKGYRKTSSYHNFEHAFCASHCMFVIVRTCSQKFSYLEQMALMTAMLCHDIDHPGNTNPFLKASEHPLSKLYKFAFLENHHSNVTRILINVSAMQAICQCYSVHWEQYCKIFDHLAPDDYKAMVDDMHRLIVATDLAKHFRKKKYLDDLVKEKRFDDTLPAHKMHLKTIIMTTCDLSGQFKPFDRTRDITFSLYIELYREGDWLKSKGLPVHSTLDRTRYLDIPQDQVNFLSMVVIPCVQLLVQMVPVLKDPYTLSTIWIYGNEYHSANYSTSNTFEALIFFEPRCEELVTTRESHPGSPLPILPMKMKDLPQPMLQASYSSHEQLLAELQQIQSKLGFRLHLEVQSNQLMHNILLYSKATIRFADTGSCSKHAELFLTILKNWRFREESCCCTADFAISC